VLLRDSARHDAPEGRDRRALPSFGFERHEARRSRVDHGFQRTPLGFQSKYEDFRQHGTTPDKVFFSTENTFDVEIFRCSGLSN
jgi:hypothetical protein